jgi:predicted aldo/keto reductase-like oxidoreductase
VWGPGWRKTQKVERVKLGRTAILVSKLGIGTGTEHPSGHCAQALMRKDELSDLLLFALERGINFWDTALQYETQPHIREALKQVQRDKVVISTKLVSSGSQETIDKLHAALSELGVDYVDICLVHGVRTDQELRSRRGALDALLQGKEAGKIRAVGISSHGLSALQAVVKIPEIDLVWARINVAGLNMDTSDLSLYDQLASVVRLKQLAHAVLPERLITEIRRRSSGVPASEANRQVVEETLRSIHAQAKGVVGMKLIAAGRLRDRAPEAVRYVKDLPFVDAFVIGMLHKEEIIENCRLVEER